MSGFSEGFPEKFSSLQIFRFRAMNQDFEKILLNFITYKTGKISNDRFENFPEIHDPEFVVSTKK